MSRITWICELLYKNGNNKVCKSGFFSTWLGVSSSLFLKGQISFNAKIEKRCLFTFHLMVSSGFKIPSASKSHLTCSHFLPMPHAWKSPLFPPAPLSKSEESNKIKLICTKLWITGSFSKNIFISTVITHIDKCSHRCIK